MGPTGGFNLITHSGKVVLSAPSGPGWAVEVETGLLEQADFQVWYVREALVRASGPRKHFFRRDPVTPRVELATVKFLRRLADEYEKGLSARRR